MRQSVLLAALNCNVKILLPKIRQIGKISRDIIASSLKVADFISPSIVPNAYTDQGSYTLGFWLWIPTDYYQRMTSKIHVLTRVPEGNEVNIMSLFDVDLFLLMCCFF